MKTNSHNYSLEKTRKIGSRFYRLNASGTVLSWPEHAGGLGNVLHPDLPSFYDFVAKQGGQPCRAP